MSSPDPQALDALKEEHDKLLEKYDEAADAIQGLEEERDGLLQKLAPLRKEYTERTREVNELTKQKRVLKRGVKQAEAEIEEWEQLKQEQLARLRTEFEQEATRDLEARRTELEASYEHRVAESVAVREAELHALSSRLDARSQDLEAREEELKGREAKLDEREADVAPKVKALEERARHMDAEDQRILKDRKYLDRDQKKLADQKAQIQAREKKSLKQKDEAVNQLAEAEELLRTVEAQEWTLKKREAEVEAGFPERAKEIRAQLDTAFESLRKEQKAFEADRDAWSLSKQDLIVAERGRLQTEREEVRSEAATLAREREIYEEDAADLEAEHAAFEERVARAAGARMSELEAQVAHLKDQLDGMAACATALNDEVRALRTADVRTKDRSLADLDTELEALRRANEELQVELDERLSPAEQNRLQEFEHREQRWIRERDQMATRLAELERTEREAGVERMQHDALETELATWKNEASLLRARLDRLNELINAGHVRQSAFPRLAAIDERSEVQESPEVLALREPDRLADLVEAVRSDLAGQGLYYASDTLRMYLAGLAMSRLIILEGMPGTGKTTLAQAFANIVHGGWQKIEVQAGWRDKQDLLGHYNTFERQFSEPLFLESLYLAQTPAYRDRPFFIVLDEINLSRPEYYFADFLSVLEERETEPTASIPRGAIDAVRVAIMNKPLADSSASAKDAVREGGAVSLPIGLRRFSGTAIGVPDNVWFVGTANQDETTLLPAPKTYDRAHVQELPLQRPEASAMRDHAFDFEARPLGFLGLHSAFAAAQKAHAGDIEWAKEVLGTLSGPFNEQKVAWSNRLLRQIAPFISVYVAAGGERAAALDHLLATKVLYKLRSRYGLTRDALQKIDSAAEFVELEHMIELSSSRQVLKDVRGML